MTRLPALLAAAAALALSAPAAAQDFAITHATVALGDGSEPIDDATLVVRGGKVVAVGKGIAVPQGVEQIDGTGKWVTPGLFSALTDLGLYDVDAVEQSRDVSADKAIFSAALDIAPVVNPLAQNIKVSRAGGVTRASVFPRSGNAIFAGQGAVIDLGSDSEALVKPRAFQYVELGEGGGALAGGSRTAAYVTFRNALAEAQDLAGRNGRNDDALLNRPDAAALIPVVEGRQPLYVHVERAADILAVLKLRQDFPKLDLVLAGASEGWMVAKEIAAAKVPVIANALNDLPAQFEQLAATQSNVGRMHAAGVKVAIGRFFDMNQPRYAPQQAGNLVALTKLPGASGLSWGAAFAAISSVPAEISGMPGMGVLKAGATGDVVIWNGDPLELSSAPMRVFVDGVEQPLESHQTKLRDRYRTPQEGALPKAYEW